jgi:hypothetical protein
MNLQASTGSADVDKIIAHVVSSRANIGPTDVVHDLGPGSGVVTDALGQCPPTGPYVVTRQADPPISRSPLTEDLG